MNNYVNDFNNTVKVYYEDLKRYQPLSKEEEKELFIKAKSGNMKARDKILTSSLRFVFNVAKKYTGYGVSVDDLIAEGNKGLIKAYDKFDINQDVKFISYGVWWIRQAMQEFVRKNNQRNSMITDEDLERPIKINEASNSLFDEEDEQIKTTDVIFSNEREETEKAKELADKRMISQLMGKLDERETYIISSYFGLEQKNKTLEEIGQSMNPKMSKERIRQIKEKALRKLRTEALILAN